MNTYILKPFEIKKGATGNSLFQSWSAYTSKVYPKINRDYTSLFWFSVPIFVNALDSGAITPDDFKRCIINGDFYEGRIGDKIGVLSRICSDRNIHSDFVQSCFSSMSCRPGIELEFSRSVAFDRVVKFGLYADLDNLFDRLHLSIDMTDLKNMYHTILNQDFHSNVRFLSKVGFIDTSNSVIALTTITKTLNEELDYLSDAGVTTLDKSKTRIEGTHALKDSLHAHRCTNEIEELGRMEFVPGVSLEQFYVSYSYIKDNKDYFKEKLNFTLDDFKFKVHMLQAYKNIWGILDNDVDKIAKNISRSGVLSHITTADIITIDRLLEQYPEHRVPIELSALLGTVEPLLSIFDTHEIKDLELPSFEGLSHD